MSTVRPEWEIRQKEAEPWVRAKLHTMAKMKTKVSQTNEDNEKK